MNSLDKENQLRLYSLFNELNHEFFEGILPQIELKFSGRLKTTGGQFFKRPFYKIQISSRYLKMSNAWDEIKNTLGHEMVHYWLAYLGRPCGHTPEFKKKLHACGFDRYSRLTPVNAKYVYQCPQCQTKYFRKRRGLWSCGPCSGRRFNFRFRLILTEKLTSI